MPFTSDPVGAVAREEARVARLERELKESRAALESLRRLDTLDTLFLAMPVSWKGTLVQYMDREIPMLYRMFEKRLRGYRAIG